MLKIVLILLFLFLAILDVLIIFGRSPEQLLQSDSKKEKQCKSQINNSELK